MNVAELHTEHLTGNPHPDDAVALHTETTEYLEQNGYSVDATPCYAVVSDSGKGYIVSRIETHTRPFEEADAVADAIEIWSCSCDDYRYNSGLPNLAEESPEGYEPCKHCKACRKELRAEHDEQQDTLG